VTPSELRARLARPILASIGALHDPGPARIALPSVASLGALLDGDRGAHLHPRPLVPAAVLVAFVLGRTPSVLLTKRTAHLTKHAGQVSFPGGRIDPDDHSAEAAALREAHEEVGLAPDQVDIIGRLGDYVTGTGYRITPVLGLLPEGRELSALGLVPSPHEVDEVFALPLGVLMDPDAPQLRRAEAGGKTREFWVWPHDDHYIWGATAAILVHVAQRLREG
jgi:8-oxo-dGTP pyrophosphatase MutT (NUDIX family)